MKGRCFTEKIERNLKKLRLKPIFSLDTPHVVCWLMNPEGVARQGRAANAA